MQGRTAGWAVIAATALAVAIGGGAADAATPRPPSEDVITGRPPVVQGPPRKGRSLPCRIDGPALDGGLDYPKARGTLNAAMIFVDFSDAPAGPDSDIQEVYDRLVPGAQTTLSDLSYKRFDLSVTANRRWVRMPKPLGFYDVGASETKYDPYERYIKDALRAAAPTFDFSQYKVVYIVAGRGANAPEQYTMPGLKVGGGRVDHVVTLDGYSDETDAATTVHETGHVLGLPDMYETDSKGNWFRFVGPWDIMSDVYHARPMLSWTRRLLGWLDDKDFRCVRDSSTVALTPVDRAGGTKAAVVRLGPRRAYLIEMRTDAVGVECPDQGILIYKWNGNVATGEGPFRVIDAQPGEGSCGPHTTALFKRGASGKSKYTDKRVAVSVLGGNADSLRVRVRAR